MSLFYPRSSHSPCYGTPTPTGQPTASPRVGPNHSIYLDLTSIELDNAIDIPIDLGNIVGGAASRYPQWPVTREDLKSNQRRATSHPDLRDCDRPGARVGISNLGRAVGKERGWACVMLQTCQTLVLARFVIVNDSFGMPREVRMLDSLIHVPILYTRPCAPSTQKSVLRYPMVSLAQC